MRVSIITLTFNSKKTILKTINSIKGQTYKNIEKIWIDNQSTDGTYEILKENKDQDTVLISEKDKGICDAFNKGYKLYSGDIVGFLHSDDQFVHNDVIKNIVNIFEKKEINFIYSNLNYIKKNNKVFRKWLGGQVNFNYEKNTFYEKKLKYGWMPPHPTTYIKSGFQKKIGLFNEDYSISFDYDYLVRCFKNKNIKSYFLNQFTVNMYLGGNSNKSLKNILKKMIEDYKIIKLNKLNGLITLIFKNLTKIKQFF